MFGKRWYAITYAGRSTYIVKAHSKSKATDTIIHYIWTQEQLEEQARRNIIDAAYHTALNIANGNMREAIRIVIEDIKRYLYIVDMGKVEKNDNRPMVIH